MKSAMAKAIDAMDASHGWTEHHNHHDRLRKLYTASQWTGELVHYETPQAKDGPDCLLVAMIAVKGGALVRVPILRNVGANFAGIVVKLLA